ncbi:hypothetical protein FJT64_018633 [Amphibalanus amphitrite]|uniref:Uncharacterized protein n=1 Tax=Amphibalanus amphitrite TaxID=1232801 RepID=A0A6A4WYE5_AMPAM|nr:hypothetical protein FJT64_018633 [Amphibalanus amphitrite]
MKGRCDKKAHLTGYKAGDKVWVTDPTAAAKALYRSNDMYKKDGERVSDPMDTIKEVLEVLAEKDVIMIGPLPRACDRGRRWEDTRA